MRMFPTPRLSTFLAVDKVALQLSHALANQRNIRIQLGAKVFARPSPVADVRPAAFPFTRPSAPLFSPHAYGRVVRTVIDSAIDSQDSKLFQM